MSELEYDALVDITVTLTSTNHGVLLYRAYVADKMVDWVVLGQSY